MDVAFITDQMQWFHILKNGRSVLAGWVRTVVTVFSITPIAFSASAVENGSVSISRFQGAAGFNQSCILFMNLAAGMLDEADYQHDLTGKGDLIALSDDIALGIQRWRGGLTAEEVQFYKRESYKLDPRQVTVIDVNTYVPSDQAGPILHEWREKNPGLIFPHRFDVYDPYNGKVSYGIVRSTLRLISGQVRLLNRSAVKRFRLPWMIEFPELERRTRTRTENNFMWELGRAGQFEPDLIKLNLSLGVLIAYQELMQAHGNLDEAKIFIHSKMQKLTGIYTTDYHFEEFGVPDPEKQDRILMRPLKELLLENPPSEIIKPLKTIMTIAGLDQLAAMDILLKASQAEYKRYDIVRPRGHRVYVGVEDFSDLPRRIYHEIAASHALTESATEELVDFLLSARTSKKRIDQRMPHEDEKESAAREVIRGRIRSMRGIQITHIDDQLGKRPLDALVERLAALALAQQENLKIFKAKMKAPLTVTPTFYIGGSDRRLLALLDALGFEGDPRFLQKKWAYTLYELPLARILALKRKYPSAFKKAKAKLALDYFQNQYTLKFPFQP